MLKNGSVLSLKVKYKQINMKKTNKYRVTFSNLKIQKTAVYLSCTAYFN